jgi:hypothetical protein
MKGTRDLSENIFLVPADVIPSNDFAWRIFSRPDIDNISSKLYTSLSNIFMENEKRLNNIRRKISIYIEWEKKISPFIA